MRTIVIRCQNGIVVWVLVPTGLHSKQWVCTRDRFIILAPDTPQDVEAFLRDMATHSSSLSGAILQVVELEL